MGFRAVLGRLQETWLAVPGACSAVLARQAERMDSEIISTIIARSGRSIKVRDHGRGEKGKAHPFLILTGARANWAALRKSLRVMVVSHYDTARRLFR